MRHRFFAAAYRGSAVPQISIWLGLSLGLLPSGIAAASEAPLPATAAPALSAVPADQAPDANLDASTSDISADAILEGFTATESVGAEATLSPDAQSATEQATTEQSATEQSTSEQPCVTGCNRGTPFVFQAPVEAIAPTAPIAASTLNRRTIRATARATTRASAPTPAAPPTSSTPIEPTAAIAPDAPTPAPTSPAARTAETRAAARATTANRAATRATVRAATAERDPMFGMQSISNPPVAVPVVVSDSDYQTPFPVESTPAGSSPADAAPPTNAAPIDSASPAPATPTAATSRHRRPLTPPSLQIHGVYVYQGGESSARARFTGLYPITPNLQAGGSVDLTTGSGGLFNEENSSGVSINELYLTGSLPSMPNLRLVVGQIDLTSYFDRNSFAKDGETQFFNPIFQTNPALTAVGIGSRAGALVNWSITDDLDVRAAAFSSDRSISDFSIDGFAGEIALRPADNFVVRGTYATGRDNGANTGFREIYSIQNGRGLRANDREEAYGVNAELFIPEIRMGIFGRYGHYRNLAIDLGGDTFVFGVSFLDLAMPNDRLGIAYGRGLSNDRLRQDLGDSLSDVGEIFYDFEVVPHLRLGFTLQALNNFSETIAGVRIRTVFNLTPRRSH